METAQEERNGGETGDKTRSGEDGERKCVLEDLSRQKMNVSKDSSAGEG